jgi:hypothetical protein
MDELGGFGSLGTDLTSYSGPGSIIWRRTQRLKAVQVHFLSSSGKILAAHYGQYEVAKEMVGILCSKHLIS